MRYIIFFAFLTICSAYSYQTGYGSGYGYGSGVGSIYNFGKDYQINPNGSLTIYTSNGEKITVSKGIDQKHVVVTVVNSTVTGEKGYPYWTPADFLADILARYEGEVSPSTYQQLLQEVYSGVQAGKINNFGVYQYLQMLNPILDLAEQGQIMQQLYQQQAMYPRGQGVGVAPQFNKPLWNVAGLGGKSFYDYTNWQNPMPYFMYNKLGNFGQPGQLPQLFRGENVGYTLNQMVPQSSFSQLYPKFYPGGLYGGYGQGMQQFYNGPMVV